MGLTVRYSAVGVYQYQVPGGRLATGVPHTVPRVPGAPSNAREHADPSTAAIGVGEDMTPWLHPKDLKLLLARTVEGDGYGGEMLRHDTA